MIIKVKKFISKIFFLGRIKKIILKLFSKNSNKTILLNVNGGLLNLYKGNFIEDKIINNYELEPHITRIFKSIVKERYVCLDIGANIGFHSITMSRLVGEKGKIYAFEPINYLQKKLNTNICLSGIKNIQIVKAAVGSENTSSFISRSIFLNIFYFFVQFFDRCQTFKLLNIILYA